MIKVIMYTKTKCPNCDRAKMLFGRCPVPIEIEYRNIELKDKYMEELREQDIMTVPSFNINGKWIEGFNEGKIMEVLGL